MPNDIFQELSLIIVVAAVVSLIMRLLRQPLILGYIITGILVGPAAFNMIHSKDMFNAFSSIGIALLLFIIGLGMNLSTVRKLGKTVFVAALVELVFIGSIGIMISRGIGFNMTEAFIIGLSLFFSSTIIIVKFLSDKKEQNRLHGQISIGVILLDDFVATIALLFVAAGKGHSAGATEIGLMLLKGLLLLVFLIVTSNSFLPKIVKAMAASQEMLFLFAVAWGFGVASLFEIAGFSIEVGALFAGVALASLPYAQEIESRLKPLRDFFVVLFFIVLGESLSFNNLSAAIIPALLLSAAVIILKPASIITTLGLMGYAKRVSFKAGINLSQISEFSIVLVVLAVANGVVGSNLSAIITLVAIITIATSSYLMQYDDELYKIFNRWNIRLFDRENQKSDSRPKPGYQLILFGYRRGGHEFVKTFQEMKKRYVVVDYDPTVIEQLQQKRVPCMYGDAADSELLDEVGIQSAKLVVSTVADFSTNEQLVRHMNLYNPEAVIICNANSYEEAMQLYELGSSYVMIPHYLGSEKLGTFIQKKGLDREEFRKHREQHLTYLEAHRPIVLAEEAL